MLEPVTRQSPDLKSLAARINEEHAAAEGHVRSAVEHAVIAGRLLIEVKAQVPHGGWLPWVAEHCNFSARTVRNYMQLARLGDADWQRVANLPLRDALAVLAEPRSTPEITVSVSQVLEETADLPKLPESDQGTAIQSIDFEPPRSNGRELLEEDMSEVVVAEGVTVIQPRQDLAVHYSSASPEWYTPQHIIDLVIEVMDGIDLDPCSNSKTAPNVPAEQHYNREDDGLSRPWHGRIYLNPPYGAGIESWIDKLAAEVAAGRVREAIALVPARTDTAWFRRLPTELICFINGRLRFSEHENAAPFPSAVAYIGLRPWRFVEAFEPIGKMFACFAPDWR